MSDLPGMWEEADLSGGQTDAANATSSGEHAVFSLAMLAAQQNCALALLHMQDIKGRVITAAEKRTADECIAAVRKVFGVTE